MNVNQILLRSLMAHRAPMPPDARILLTATSLPSRLKERVVNGDLKGLSWRASSSGADVTFMAATRVVTDQPVTRREVLRAVAIGPDGEEAGLWRHKGSGTWELVVGG